MNWICVYLGIYESLLLLNALTDIHQICRNFWKFSEFLSNAPPHGENHGEKYGKTICPRKTIPQGIPHGETHGETPE